MNYRQAQQGFTAVELLITLFVAAAFLIAGYQLFNIVIKDGGETRAESSAGNVAYDYLRRYSNSATNPCTAQSPMTSQSVSVPDISDVRVTIAITCPQTDAPSLSQVEAIVTYGNPSATVRVATYVDKSKGASPNVELTDGMIAWWPLNGNGNSTVGNFNMTNTGATPITGQNGQANSAMSFVAPPSALVYPNFSSTMVGRNAFSITAWVYPPSSPSTHSGILGFRDDAVGGVHFLQVTGTNNLECRMRVNSTTYYQPATAPVLTPNTWQLVSAVYDGSTWRCYVNTTAPAAVGASWGSFNGTSIPLYIGSTSGQDPYYMRNGRIDDVRIYGRALSLAEIQGLISAGAK